MTLKNYLPSYYINAKSMHDVLAALETELVRFKAEVQSIEDAFFVLFAEKYIDRHLADLGLPITGDGLCAKRCLILARLRGTGTLTKEALQGIAETFIDGYIEITEFPDWHVFHIDYDNTEVSPEALQGLWHTIDELKPAHLNFEILSYVVSWARLDGFDYTWQQWDNMDLTFDQWEIYHE